MTGSLWLSRYDDGFDDQTIWVAEWNRSAWEAPQVAPFSGEWGDRSPRFSPDGARLFFTSNRPLDGSDEAGDMNTWVVHAAFYLASQREGGLGRSDIYRFPREESGWGEAEHLPQPLNDASSQPDLLVAVDEAWMILVVTDHAMGLGGDDLFVMRRANVYRVQLAALGLTPVR